MQKNVQNKQKPLDQKNAPKSRKQQFRQHRWEQEQQNEPESDLEVIICKRKVEINDFLEIAFFDPKSKNRAWEERWDHR